MKKILLYAAVPFFSSFHITQYSGLYSQNTWSGWPSSLSRTHSSDEKNFVGSQTGEVECIWKYCPNLTKTTINTTIYNLQSKLVIFFSPPNNFIVQIDETQKTKEKTHLRLLIQQKSRHSAHRKAHRQPNRF